MLTAAWLGAGKAIIIILPMGLLNATNGSKAGSEARSCARFLRGQVGTCQWVLRQPLI